jgi:acyl dehydratase
MKIERVEAAAGHRTVTDAAVSAFGTLTGDYARMHFDHHAGKDSRIGGTIAHGLLSACWAIGMLTRCAPRQLGVGDPAVVLSDLSVRFGRMVYVGDTLCVKSRTEDGGVVAFEMLNQHGEVVTSGRATLSRGQLAPSPKPWTLGAWQAPPAGEICYADEMQAKGPRGDGRGRTVTEADIVRFASEVGETNPLYLNQVFAEAGRFGARIAPPMLSFCLCFSDFLDALLSMPLPSTGSAGHLGDSFRLHAPVSIGDTIRGRYCVLGARPSNSRAGMSVVEFGLQVLNQHDQVVQQGGIAMLIARRREL